MVNLRTLMQGRRHEKKTGGGVLRLPLVIQDFKTLKKSLLVPGSQF